MIDLYTPSGIGDIYWILMKLARRANDQKEKFRIHTPPGNGDKFSRGKFLEFIDCVESVEPDGISYHDLIGRAKHYEQLEPVMYCECNTWLESGQRIEFYMHSMPTEFILNWQMTDQSIRKAKKYLRADKKNIVVYTSGVANNASSSTGDWKAADWKSRLENIKTLRDINLIWIGASYDTDILPQIKHCFDYIVIDEGADIIINLLRLCDGFISYQSGLSVISVIESIPTLMLYFRKIDKLRFTFNPPNGNYEAVFFDYHPVFYNWVKDLPLRNVLGRDKKQLDYTFWVNDNVEQTEKDWLENPQGHREQYETIADLEGSVIEVGCGSGQLATYMKNGYIGLDQSEALLELCRQKNPSKTFNLIDIRDVISDIDFADNVCSFGFMKHFALKEWDSIFAKLASMALQTLTIETPIEENDWEELGYDFPHVFVTDKRVRENASRNGFEVVKVTKNSANEFTYRMKRIDGK